MDDMAQISPQQQLHDIVVIITQLQEMTQAMLSAAEDALDAASELTVITAAIEAAAEVPTYQDAQQAIRP